MQRENKNNVSAGGAYGTTPTPVDPPQQPVQIGDGTFASKVIQWRNMQQRNANRPAAAANAATGCGSAGASKSSLPSKLNQLLEEDFPDFQPVGYRKSRSNKPKEIIKIPTLPTVGEQKEDGDESEADAGNNLQNLFNQCSMEPSNPNINGNKQFESEIETEGAVGYTAGWSPRSIAGPEQTHNLPSNQPPQFVFSKEFYNNLASNTAWCGTMPTNTQPYPSAGAFGYTGSNEQHYNPHGAYNRSGNLPQYEPWSVGDPELTNNLFFEQHRPKPILANDPYGLNALGRRLKRQAWDTYGIDLLTLGIDFSSSSQPALEYFEGALDRQYTIKQIASEFCRSGEVVKLVNENCKMHQIPKYFGRLSEKILEEKCMHMLNQSKQEEPSCDLVKGLAELAQLFDLNDKSEKTKVVRNADGLIKQQSDDVFGLRTLAQRIDENEDLLADVKTTNNTATQQQSKQSHTPADVLYMGKPMHYDAAVYSEANESPRATNAQPAHAANYGELKDPPKDPWHSPQDAELEQETSDEDATHLHLWQDVEYKPEELTGTDELNIAYKTRPHKLSYKYRHIGDLFFIFYNSDRDLHQMAAALELYRRNWTFYAPDRIWINGLPDAEGYEQAQEIIHGYFAYFNRSIWMIAYKNFAINPAYLEKQKNIRIYLNVCLENTPCLKCTVTKFQKDIYKNHNQ